MAWWRGGGWSEKGKRLLNSLGVFYLAEEFLVAIFNHRTTKISESRRKEKRGRKEGGGRSGKLLKNLGEK